MKQWICGKCHTRLDADVAGTCPSCGSEDVIPVGSPRGAQLAGKPRSPPPAPVPASLRRWRWVFRLGVLAVAIAVVVGVWRAFDPPSGPPVGISEIHIQKTSDGYGVRMWFALVDAQGATTEGTGKATVTITDRDGKSLGIQYIPDISPANFHRATIGIGAFERKMTIYTTPIGYTLVELKGAREARLEFETSDGQTFMAKEGLFF